MFNIMIVCTIIMVTIALTLLYMHQYSRLFQGLPAQSLRQLPNSSLDMDVEDHIQGYEGSFVSGRSRLSTANE